MSPKRTTHPDCIISTFVQDTILALVFGHLYTHFMPGMPDLSSEKMTNLWRREFSVSSRSASLYCSMGLFEASRWNFSSQRCLQRREPRRYLIFFGDSGALSVAESSGLAGAIGSFVSQKGLPQGRVRPSRIDLRQMQKYHNTMDGYKYRQY